MLWDCQSLFDPEVEAIDVPVKRTREATKVGKGDAVDGLLDVASFTTISTCSFVRQDRTRLVMSIFEIESLVGSSKVWGLLSRDRSPTKRTEDTQSCPCIGIEISFSRSCKQVHRR